MLRGGFCLFVVLLFIPNFAFGQERGIGLTRKLVSSPLFQGEHRALVIGNDAYRDPKGLWGPLKTAVNDAQAVASALRDDYRFEDVRLLKNATRREMIQAFNELADQSRENDSVLVYYAGHGYLREATGEGFWIPVDAEGRDDSTYVPNAVIKTKISVIADRAQHVLLISDSCFSGGLLRGGNRGVELDAKTENYYRKVARRKSVQVLAAGGLEFVDDNYRGTGHSPFTYYLLEELKFNEEPLLETTDLSQTVTRNVAINVNQTPVKGVLQGSGHAGGEFFFLKPQSAPKVAPASPQQPPKQEAALPLVAPLAPTVVATTASTAGGASAGLLAGGGIFALIAVQQYLEASDKHAKAQEKAEDDPEKSAELEAERDAATQNALLAGAISIGLLVWGSQSGGDVATTQPEGWSVAPLVVKRDGNTTPGVMVRGRW